MLIIFIVVIIHYTINYSNNSIHFNPTFKLKYLIIFITEAVFPTAFNFIFGSIYMQIHFLQAGGACRAREVSSVMAVIKKALLSLIPPFDVVMSQCFSEESASAHLLDSASRTGLTGHSVPPVLFTTLLGSKLFQCFQPQLLISQNTIP